MKERSITEIKDRKFEALKESLEIKLNAFHESVNPKEKQMIADAIYRIEFPFSVKNLLVYLNEETANLLADSTHPLLKEWGTHGKSFYLNDPQKKYVQATSGLVMTPSIGRGGPASPCWMTAANGYSVKLSYMQGNGNWSTTRHCWIPSPTSRNYSSEHIETVLNDWLYRPTVVYGVDRDVVPAMNPPNLLTSPFKLISPLHVAALIGDIKLIEYLIEKGVSLNDDCNEWRITPFEMAVLCGQIDSIDFMRPHTVNQNKGLKLAVEKCSFYIIEKLVNHHVTLTDDIMETARLRDQDLYFYLDMRRKMDVEQRIMSEGALNALQSTLNLPHIPVQSLIDLICAHPEVIHAIPSEADGNTLLHQLIIDAKDAVKVKAYLSAIFQALYLFNGLQFDIENKNKAEQTALKLAINKGNKEVIAAVMLYGNPIYTGFETELHSMQINIAAINQERAALILKTTQKIAHVSLTNNRLLSETNFNMAALASEIMQIKMVLKQTQEMLAESQQEKRFYQSAFMSICRKLELELPAPPSTPVLPFYSEGNAGLLFATSGTAFASPAPASHPLRGTTSESPAPASHTL